MKRFKGLGRIRDSVVEKSKAASEAVQQLGEVSKAALDTTVEQTRTTTSEAGRRMVEVSKETLEAAVEQTQTVSRDAVNKVYTECPVTMFMLPTGPNPEDYFLAFRFDEVLDNLNSGLLVRPKLEILSARAVSYDTERLGQGIKQEFSSQLDHLKSERKRAYEKLVSELPGPTAESIIIGVTLMFFLSPLALLAWAFGINMISMIWDYWRKDKINAQRELNRELNRDLKELDSKNSAFQQAIGNIEVKMHPRIRNLAEMICEVDLVPFDPGDTEREQSDIPDTQIPFRHSIYLKRLPSLYHEFLDVV